MAKATSPASQLTLSLFDSTSLGWDLTLDAPRRGSAAGQILNP